MNNSIDRYIEKGISDPRLTDEQVRAALAKYWIASQNGKDLYSELVQAIQNAYLENGKDPKSKITSFLNQMHIDAKGDLTELVLHLVNFLPGFIFNAIDNELAWSKARQEFAHKMYLKELNEDEERRNKFRNEEKYSRRHETNVTRYDDRSSSLGVSSYRG